MSKIPVFDIINFTGVFLFFAWLKRYADPDSGKDAMHRVFATVRVKTANTYTTAVRVKTADRAGNTVRPVERHLPYGEIASPVERHL